MSCISSHIAIKHDFYSRKYLLEIFFFKKKVRVKADKYHCKLNVAIASTKLVHLVHVLEKKIEMITACICTSIAGYVDV